MKNERFLSQEDATILCRLAEHLLRMRDVTFNIAEQLIELIGSSILLPENAERSDYVALYSEVTFREVGSMRLETIFLVCPQDTQDALARVSILSPIALALLGRPLGSITAVTLPFFKVRYVEVVGIRHSNEDRHARTIAGAKRYA
ncbi:GreA/GreB family elongation factor [Noviherbaspirillum sp. ST9]|uniref:GreA/GreB family elongation factor n=1 Tax=Noviherbaspirillum sp. ST9 TaxID=3401606 RepID=UPI003B588369